MRPRPLSPHLQIYKPQLTSLMSISHRLTGMVLAAGSVFLVAWLVALAMGGTWYATTQAMASHIVGRLLLFGFWLAVAYHMGNGIRHLLWDFGVGLSLKAVYRSGWLVQLWLVVAAALGIKILFLAGGFDVAAILEFDIASFIDSVTNWFRQWLPRGSGP